MPDEHEALTDPALPAGALATLDSGIRTGAAGAGRGPLSLARWAGGLTSVLVLAVVATMGFIGGVQIQKRQRVTTVAGTGGAGGATLGASAGARGGAGGGPSTTAGPATTAGAEAAPTTAGAAAGGAGAGAARPRAGGAAGAAGAPLGAGAAGAAAAGQVKSVDGVNIFVTDPQGNVVKVVTTPSSRFTRTGPGSLQDLRPGDTVIVQGQKGEDGIVTATAVSDSGTA
jgi:hypothetical protein